MRSFNLILLIVAMLTSHACADQPRRNADIDKATAKYESVRKIARRFGSQHAPEKPANTLRLSTYNIENLFDDHDDPELSGDQDDADETKPDHELDAVARTIRAIDADILCLQEIESERALLWFRDNHLSDMGYDHVASIDAGNSRGIENSVLSRFPITHIENWPNKPLGGVHPDLYGDQPNWYAGEPIAFRRSPLRVDVEIPGDEGSDPWTLTLFVIHHKSGRHNGYWRDAEAKGILELVKGVERTHPERPIALLGDFNAQVSDDSVKTYLENGFIDLFGRHPTSSEIITHESNRRIDLILANAHAIKKMHHSDAFVYGTAARPESVSWRDVETFDGYASDHYPVSVDLDHN